MRYTLLIASLLIFSAGNLSAQDSTVSLAYRINTFSYPGTYFPKSDQSRFLQEKLELVQKGSAGNPNAQHEIGIRHLLGYGFEKDTVKAYNWIKKAADQKHVQANYNAGIFKNNGWGTDWDPFGAFEHFLFAAERGMGQAQYVVGVMYTENLIIERDFEKAYNWMKRAAGSGFEPAREIVKKIEDSGKIKKDSTGVKETAPPPQVKSNVSLVYLDFNSDTSSMTIGDSIILADMIKTDESYFRNFTGMGSLDTLKYLPDSVIVRIEKSASAGSPEALTLQGRMYEKGVVYKQDNTKASVNYIRALRLDSPRSGYLMWDIYTRQDFYDRISKLILEGNADAMYIMAGLKAIGFDYMINEDQAVRFLRSAAGQDHIPALLELGVIYRTGDTEKLNIEKAHEYWSRARELGSLEAPVRIIMSRISSGDIKNTEAMIIQLVNAQKEGSVLAQTMLGYCYQNGIGVEKNLATATEYYKDAAFRGSYNAFRSLKAMYDIKRPPDPKYIINTF